MLQSELVDQNAETAEIVAQRVHIFAKALREEFVISNNVPREFPVAGAASTLPQRKMKGKTKARTLTSTETAERRNKRSRFCPGPGPGPGPTNQSALRMGNECMENENRK